MPISVNEAIDRLEELDGKEVEIFGVLSLKFEGHCITHTPCSERRKPAVDSGCFSRSSIWTNYDLQKMGTTKEALKRFHRWQVVVIGNLQKPAPSSSGCGHFSLWPAEIDVTRIIHCGQDN